MQKLILFLVMLFLSLSVSAVSINDLNEAMKSTISTTPQGTKNILYGGQDVLNAPAAIS
ncbi:MAG: hypothetical protein K0R24_1448 [Gammaproteobacteria bacterium]|jgi:hypothetical protein|nr:hypothetical protein [Gammaproteobacteria bacterium]